MINKIVAIQANHISKLNPKFDTSLFLANEIQTKKYKIFFYQPKDLSIINSKVYANGFFIRFDYSKRKCFEILKKKKSTFQNVSLSLLDKIHHSILNIFQLLTF